MKGKLELDGKNEELRPFAPPLRTFNGEVLGNAKVDKNELVLPNINTILKEGKEGKMQEKLKKAIFVAEGRTLINCSVEDMNILYMHLDAIAREHSLTSINSYECSIDGLLNDWRQAATKGRVFVRGNAKVGENELVLPIHIITDGLKKQLKKVNFQELNQLLKEGKMQEKRQKDISLLRECIDLHMVKLNKLCDRVGWSYTHFTDTVKIGFKDINISIGSNVCPLCREYDDSIEDLCSHCPIKLKTGQSGCNGSPYESFIKLIKKKGCVSDDIINAQKDEIVFLTDLMVELSLQGEVVYKAGDKFTKDGEDFMLMYGDYEMRCLDLFNMGKCCPVNDNLTNKNEVSKKEFEDLWGEGYEGGE